jgi:hypothetical protein
MMLSMVFNKLSGGVLFDEFSVFVKSYCNSVIFVMRGIDLPSTFAIMYAKKVNRSG